MNLKLNNKDKSCNAGDVTDFFPKISKKEERRRTGRYIAVLAGISILTLALYHAWVRKVPLIASVVIPAIIMFIYIGWIFYTASKKRTKYNFNDGETTANDFPVNRDADKKLRLQIKSEKNRREFNETKTMLRNTPTILLPHHKIQTPLIFVNDEPVPEFSYPHLLNINKRRKRRHRFNRNFMLHKRKYVFKRSYTIT